MQVKLDNLKSPEVIELLQEHLLGMQAQTPPESVHALNINEFKLPEVNLWTAWSEGQLLGCGAIKNLGNAHGEIKSMRTKDNHLRRGVANAILNAIIAHAKQVGIQRLSLETGATNHFKAAQLFYRERGFEESPPFGSYKLDPHSLFFTKDLNA